MSAPSLSSIQVGHQLEKLAIPALNRTTLALYAGASGDHVPLHIDIDYARKAGMPDVFGHGMLTVAWIARMLTTWVDQRQILKINARFVGITHLANEVTCTGRVAEKWVEEDKNLVRVEIEATNQYGEIKVVAEATIAIQ